MDPESDYCVHVTHSLFSPTCKKKSTPAVLNGNISKSLNAPSAKCFSAFQFCIGKTNEAKPCCNGRRAAPHKRTEQNLMQQRKQPHTSKVLICSGEGKGQPAEHFLLKTKDLNSLYINLTENLICQMI